jgi:hypothetical protein
MLRGRRGAGYDAPGTAGEVGEQRSRQLLPLRGLVAADVEIDERLRMCRIARHILMMLVAATRLRHLALSQQLAGAALGA